MKWASAATRALLCASGADEETLKQCPSERKRFLTTGGLVFFTGFLAASAALFTSYSFWHVPLVLAVAFAAVWSVGIMNLDVWLLTSIRRQKTVPLTLLLAAPRLFLAVIVGLVIAQPLLLQAFAAEITRQVRQDNQASLTQGEQNLERDGSITALRNEQHALTADAARLASGAEIYSNPYYLTKARQYGNLKSNLDGQTTGPATSGEVAAALAALQTLKQQLAQARVASEAQDQSQLKTVSAQLAPLEANQTTSESKLQARYGSTVPIGLADRMEALGALTKQHPAVNYVKWLLLLLILAVDSLPALAKTLMSVGEPTLYERLLNRREDHETVAAERGARIVAEAAAAEEDRHRRMAALKTQHELRVTEERMRKASEADAKLGDQYLESQGRVHQLFADKLEDEVLRKAPEWADAWAEKAADEMGAEMDRHLADDAAVD